MILKLNATIRELKEMLAKDMVNITGVLNLLNRMRHKLKYCVSITNVFKDQYTLSNGKGTYAELLQRIDRVRAKFSKGLLPNLSAQQLTTFQRTAVFLIHHKRSNTPQCSVAKGKPRGRLH